MLRSGKFWAILAVVLVGLLVVADRGAQIITERVVAGQIQDAMDTPSRPSVSLGGFPFLTDLIARKLSSAEIEIRAGLAGEVRVQQLRVEVQGVTQEGRGARVERISGDGLLTYPELSAAAAPYTVAHGGGALVRITREVRVLGVPRTAAATGKPRIVGNELLIKPRQASLDGVRDPTGTVGSLPPIRIPLRDIPDGLTITLEPTAAGVRFGFTGSDVLLVDNRGRAWSAQPGEPRTLALRPATRFWPADYLPAAAGPRDPGAVARQ